MSSLSVRVVDAIASVLPGPAPLHEPSFSGNEWTYVKECLDSGWVSSAGHFGERFEDMVKGITGAAHAVTTVNGTAALHICLVAAGVGPGDEVIVPALTFVGTANAVSQAGAVPHFADSEEATLGLDPARLAAHLSVIAERRPDGCFNKETGRRLGAVVCVHLYGHPVAIDELATVCDGFGLPLIEDAAESLGSYYKGRHTGTMGRLAALSFNGNKITTTGGGGTVLTNDEALASTVRHLTTTAKVAHSWEFIHDQIGFNYRMPSINAALGCAQLEQLPLFLSRKRNLARHYQQAFEAIDGVAFAIEPEGTQSNYWLNVILLKHGAAECRDEILTASNEAGYGTRPAWRPLHTLPMYGDCPRMEVPVAEDLYRRLINLPSGPSIVPRNPPEGNASVGGDAG